jgi:hypothetical protein
MPRRTLALAVLVSAAIPFQAVWPAGQPTGAELTLAAPYERSLGDYPGHAGHAFHEQTASFRFGPVAYAIAYKACIDKAHEGKVAPLEGYIGMPVPASCNWYHSGFLFVSLNGQDIGTTPLSSMLVSERGDRAVLDLVWHHEVANVRVRFVGLPGNDYLVCEIALEPKQAISAVAVGLRCYPSFFTSHHRRAGARRIQTPAALVEEGSKATVEAGANWWGLYYDEVFDVAKGEGEGPCGMLFLSDEAAGIVFEPGDYAVGTRIEYRPEVRRLRLAFWDFKGLTNADALTRLRGCAQAVRDGLAKQDFTPAAVKGFDVAALRAEAERALKSETARAALGDRIKEVQGWLEKDAPALQQKADAPGIEAEEKLLRSIDRYNSFVWEVKLAELVGGL